MNLLREFILWFAFASLALMFLGIMMSIITSRIRFGDLLSDTSGTPPTITRTGYLFANLGLAVTFLLSVLECGNNVDALKESTKIIGELETTAVTGLASASYVWSKLKGK